MVKDHTAHFFKPLKTHKKYLLFVLCYERNREIERIEFQSVSPPLYLISV